MENLTMENKRIELDIMTIDEEIKLHKYTEVTSPIMFSANSTMPDPNGLGSYEIFGNPGSPERETTYGWINLQSIFIHPDIYRRLSIAYGNFVKISAGFNTGYIDNEGNLEILNDGDQVPNPKFKTGIGNKFLYDNWDSIKLKETGTTYWTTPNTGATNEVKFNGKGSGFRDVSDGAFYNLKLRFYIKEKRSL